MADETPAEIKNEPNDAVITDANGNGKDIVDSAYSQHGGDPRNLDISFCVLLKHLPTDFLADTYDQFSECIKNLLSEEHKLDPAMLKNIIRVPKLEASAPDQANALRALLCFGEKTHKHRMMGRKKDIECTGMQIEALEVLPDEFLQFTDEDLNALESGDYEMADEVGEDDDEEGDDGEDEKEHDEHESDNDHDTENRGDEEDGETTKDGEKKEENDEKADGDKKEAPKKKVYEDEDENAPYEVNWEGAPEFQWRICDNGRDEKKLIIENLMWADLHNVFIYRCLQRATTVDISFPMRFNSDGTRPSYGKVIIFFPVFVSIMDEAMKHLIYFRSGDGRRIKIFLPQTTASLKQKEEFEKRLGRLIQPTPRMKELIVKVLPEGFTPTLDDACGWFPNQSVVGCEVLQDEMGQNVAVVKIETADETIAAHASKSLVQITLTSSEKDKEGVEQEVKKTTNCNVFMRGVEAHFGSFLTFYDQRKKANNDRSAKRREERSSAPKRPAGSSIRAPNSKRGRRSSPPPRGPQKSARGGRNSGPRARSPPAKRSAPSGGRNGPPGRSGPPGGRSGPPGGRSGPSGRSRGGRGPPPPPRSYRQDSYTSPNIRAQGRPSLDRRSDVPPFGGYGYQPERFERPTVDPFGRPISYGQSNSYTAPFSRGNEPRGFSSFDRRRY